MNRNSRQKNSPIVPMNVAQSQIVGWYMPHDDGRKSRCRLVTTITKRSSHMPMLTTMRDRRTAPAAFVRTLLEPERPAA